MDQEEIRQRVSQARLQLFELFLYPPIKSQQVVSKLPDVVAKTVDLSQELVDGSHLSDRIVIFNVSDGVIVDQIHFVDVQLDSIDFDSSTIQLGKVSHDGIDL